MIEKMKIVSVVSLDSRKEALVGELRELGVMHFSEKAVADSECVERFALLNRTASFLKDYSDKPAEKQLDGAEFEELLNEVTAARERYASLEDERRTLSFELEKLRPWGDFSPDEIRQMREDGVDLRVYRLSKQQYKELQKTGQTQVVKLAPVEKMTTIATLGELPEDYADAEFKLPKMGAKDLASRIAECDSGMDECRGLFKKAACYLPSFDREMLSARNAEEFSSVKNTSDSEGGLVWLTGYIPEPDIDRFKEAAQSNGWAYAIDDPAEDDENVPTKIRYNRLTGLMKPVFDILGTVPGYREYDISFWFLCFFTLFFAMIIGDAGYGCVFLAAAVAYTIKSKKLNNGALLLFVLSAATIIWGAITGNWFGAKAAMDIPLLRLPVIPSMAAYPECFGVAESDQQSTVMKFCFMIGMVQLSLACVMNVRKKLPRKDLSWISDLGWLMAICAMYFVVLFLVIGREVNLGVIAGIVIAGFVLVLLFGGMSPDKTFAQGLKAGLANAFTDFLNTISAFGNIMSYIRLFAVGMASLAIAQSFNDMASGFSGPLRIAGAVIVIIGHALNIVMGLLSVIVHGARLNLLEFSGQLNMEWSGTAYKPFKKSEKL